MEDEINPKADITDIAVKDLLHQFSNAIQGNSDELGNITTALQEYISKLDIHDYDLALISAELQELRKIPELNGYYTDELIHLVRSKIGEFSYDVNYAKTLAYMFNQFNSVSRYVSMIAASCFVALVIGDIAGVNISINPSYFSDLSKGIILMGFLIVGVRLYGFFKDEKFVKSAHLNQLLQEMPGQYPNGAIGEMLSTELQGMAKRKAFRNMVNGIMSIIYTNNTDNTEG